MICSQRGSSFWVGVNFRAAVSALGTVAVGKLGLKLIPRLELDFLAAGAARLAGVFTGVGAQRGSEGWVLAAGWLPAVVTEACSGADYFLILAALIGWQLARRGKSIGFAILVGLLAAGLLTIFVNSLRIVTVVQAHRWVIPLLPDAYGHFAHMLTGAAVFLPSLIALNFLLEHHGHTRTASRV